MNSLGQLLTGCEPATRGVYAPLETTKPKLVIPDKENFQPLIDDNSLVNSQNECQRYSEDEPLKRVNRALNFEFEEQYENTEDVTDVEKPNFQFGFDDSDIIKEVFEAASSILESGLEYSSKPRITESKMLFPKIALNTLFNGQVPVMESDDMGPGLKILLPEEECQYQMRCHKYRKYSYVFYFVSAYIA